MLPLLLVLRCYFLPPVGFQDNRHTGISDMAGISLIQNNLTQDNYGIGLMLALAIKETPFLLIMSIPILKQLNVEQLSKVSASLGYSHFETWRKVILPQWLPKLRLSLFAVAAYGLSVVDIALILGPTRLQPCQSLYGNGLTIPTFNFFPVLPRVHACYCSLRLPVLVLSGSSNG